MKRRHFLQGAGILLTGSSSLDREAQASSQNERRILITSGETELAQVIADHLSRDRNVRLTGLTAVPSRFPFTPCQLDHDSATDELVQGMDAIVHVAEPPSGAGEQEQTRSPDPQDLQPVESRRGRRDRPTALSQHTGADDGLR